MIENQIKVFEGKFAWACAIAVMLVLLAVEFLEEARPADVLVGPVAFSIGIDGFVVLLGLVALGALLIGYLIGRRGK